MWTMDAVMGAAGRARSLPLPTPEAERRRMLAFIANLDLRGEIEVADVVRGSCTAELQGNGARSELLVDVEEVLNDAANFDLDILCQAYPDRGHSQPCQVAVKSGEAVGFVLQKIEAKAEAD